MCMSFPSVYKAVVSMSIRFSIFMLTISNVGQSSNYVACGLAIRSPKNGEETSGITAAHWALFFSLFTSPNNTATL